MSNFGSITGMQDQQTLLAVSASKLSFGFLTLNCFWARNPVAESKDADFVHQSNMIAGGGVGDRIFNIRFWRILVNKQELRNYLGLSFLLSLMPRAYMNFGANPFHSETVIAQSGHPQENTWHWLVFFQCHTAVVLYNQILGISPSIWKLQNWLKLGNLLKCP